MRAGATIGLSVVAALSIGRAAQAQNSPSPEVPEAAAETHALHAQATFVWQGHPAFHSGFRGANSLDPAARGNETFDLTVYAGLRLGAQTELWINPEVDQGFGLSNTLGVAAFPSGEAYKVGQSVPYMRLQRLFVRHTIDLGSQTTDVEADLNQLRGRQGAERVVLTIGKFSVGDIFDANRYAHDPRSDFMNWALIDTGTFDYAADAWGYTVGAAVEWYVGAMTLRGGLFDLSVVPNSKALDPRFAQFQGVGEVERRWGPEERQGKLKLTAYLTRGRMGSYLDALALASVSKAPADISLVRRYGSRMGVSLNLEQPLGQDLGLFARAGWAQGSREAYEFADIDRTLAGGISFRGQGWGRLDDTIGLAGVVNDISPIHRAFLNAGGTGILIGEGRLPRFGAESAIEVYYNYAVSKRARLTGDLQYVHNPAYNRDRGPVVVAGLRLHAQY